MSHYIKPKPQKYYDFIDIPVMGYCGLQMTYHRIYFFI